MKRTFHKRWVKWTISLSALVVLFATLFIVFGLKEDWAYAGKMVFDVILVENFLGITAVLLGLITLVGYLALGRGAKESFLGFLRTLIGYMIMSIGSGLIVSILKPLFIEVGDLFHGNTVVPLDPYLGWASGDEFLGNMALGIQAVSWVAYAFMVGFVLNIILVACNKWTNIHAVNVTGHIMLQQTTLVVVAFWVLLFGGVNANFTFENELALVLFAGLFIGVYWGFGSTATYRPTQDLSNNSNFAVGHQQMLGIAITYKIADKFGDPKQSAETKNLPKKLKIFEDNLFTQTLILFLIIFPLVLILNICNPGTFDPNASGNAFSTWNISGGVGGESAWWVINAILGVTECVAAIFVLVSGVRMFVTELQQAFMGISEKIIPNATVGVDIAATYGFAPNSATLGFLSGTIGQFIGVGITFMIGLFTSNGIVIAVPLFITLFFNSGALGIYANCKGGYKACIAIPFLFGLGEILLTAGFLTIFNGQPEAVATVTNTDTGVVDEYVAFGTGYNGMFDWTALFTIPGMLACVNPGVAWVVFCACVVVMLTGAQIIDSGAQNKKTSLQKLLKLNPPSLAKSRA